MVTLYKSQSTNFIGADPAQQMSSADELSRRVNEVDHPEHAKLSMSQSLLRQAEGSDEHEAG